MLVVGDREAEQRAVALRRHREGDLGTLPLDDVVARLTAEASSPQRLIRGLYSSVLIKRSNSAPRTS